MVARVKVIKSVKKSEQIATYFLSNQYIIIIAQYDKWLLGNNFIDKETVSELVLFFRSSAAKNWFMQNDDKFQPTCNTSPLHETKVY